MVTRFLIFLLFTGSCSAQPWWTPPVVVSSSTSSYLVSQGFESSGFEGQSWTKSGTFDELNATDPLSGSYSAAVTTSNTASYAYTTFAAQSGRVYGRFKLRIEPGYGSGNAWIGHCIGDATYSHGASLLYSVSNTRLQMNHGTSSINLSSASLTQGTTVWVWWWYEKGTGSDGKYSISMNTNLSYTTLSAWTNYAANGSSTYDLSRFYSGGLINSTINFRIDDIRVSSTEIGTDQ